MIFAPSPSPLLWNNSCTCYNNFFFPFFFFCFPNIFSFIGISEEMLFNGKYFILHSYITIIKGFLLVYSGDIFVPFQVIMIGQSFQFIGQGNYYQTSSCFFSFSALTVSHELDLLEVKRNIPTVGCLQFIKRHTWLNRWTESNRVFLWFFINWKIYVNAMEKM